MPKNKPSFDEWGQFHGTPQQQGCIANLMPVALLLMIVGCGLVFMYSGNPGGLDQALGAAASSHIASSATYGDGSNAVSAVFCFGIAGLFLAIFVWGMSRRSGGGNGSDQSG